MKPVASLGGVCAIACMLLPTASAEPGGWSLTRSETEGDIKTKASADYTYTSLSLATTDPNQPEISFGCSQKFGLTATLRLQPRSQGELSAGDRTSYETRTTLLSIGDRKPQRTLWFHIKELRLLQTRLGATARKLYNSAIRGDAVSVKEPFKQTVTFTLPPPDDNFAAFARECHITNGRG